MTSTANMNCSLFGRFSHMLVAQLGCTFELCITYTWNDEIFCEKHMHCILKSIGIFGWKPFSEECLLEIIHLKILHGNINFLVF